MWSPPHSSCRNSEYLRSPLLDPNVSALSADLLLSRSPAMNVLVIFVPSLLTTAFLSTRPESHSRPRPRSLYLLSSLLPSSRRRRSSVSRRSRHCLPRSRSRCISCHRVFAQSGLVSLGWNQHVRIRCPVLPHRSHFFSIHGLLVPAMLISAVSGSGRVPPLPTLASFP